MSRIQKISKQIQSSISFSCKTSTVEIPTYRVSARKEARKIKRERGKTTFPKGKKIRPTRRTGLALSIFTPEPKSNAGWSRCFSPFWSSATNPRQGAKTRGKLRASGLFFPAGHANFSRPFANATGAAFSTYVRTWIEARGTDNASTLSRTA